MNNEEVAAIFERIADLSEIKGEIIYKTLAYRKAADSIRNLGADVEAIHREGKLLDIPGVGKAIAEKIDELLTTGKLNFLLKLEQEVPPTLVDLLKVPDIGPKKAAMFWKKGGITTLAELEAAARAGKLRGLPGMGEKSEARIISGLEALARRSKRLSIGVALPIAIRWVEWLRKLPGVEQAEAAGSLRRRKITIGDLDFVAAARDPKPIMDAFIHHPEVQRIAGQGENKSSIEAAGGLNIQLWIQPPERFGTLLQFVTGSKEHNVRLRELAQKKGLSLSEQSISRADGSEQTYADEKGVYAALGLPWIPPELREDRGEIAAALAGKLPHLLVRSDLKADLHVHSTWSDGAATIAEMAAAARERGLKVLAISDHSGGLGVAGGMSVEKLHERRAEIESVQEKMGDSLRLLQGAEVEIHADGSLDYEDEVLAELDVVVASLHSSLRQPREQITERLLRAMRNPNVDVIGHPSGRLLPNREGADLDWERVLAAARETGVALEINAHPARLDLDEVYARRAAEMGIPLSLNTDAHAPDQLDLIEYGISAARRAWLEPEQIINTWPPEKLLAWLQNRGRKTH
ncbi:DNA polymerase IV [Longilinea arvoryzae]|uniref:DNA polymerase beta n=1 Tax=Longilinea arvoryzae TaxID=360412 RepID=A0A0S7BC42_9CHLR|nr:DNA polymerase/3'-5' exonuclease PolX [Longilinea arvoryzae]GAP15436.1 DNA polymerase IV [Longilinea arvoryzae]